jgi:hypothetical protein
VEIEKPKPIEVSPPPKPVEPPKPVVEIKPAVEITPPPPPPVPVPAPVVQPNVTPQIADLAALSCAKIDVRKDGGTNLLSGFVGSDSDFDLVKRVAQTVPNTSLGNVTLAPWPQRETMETLANPLAAIDPPKIDIGADRPRRSGEVLKIEIKSPPQISYLYVSYVQADGSVVHLVQPEGLVAQPTLPDQTITFGDGKDGRATFTIGAPFGREMIIAIVSRSPLFDKPLPAQQTEREYLTALRLALVYKPSPNLPDRELSASIATLQTEPRVP